MLNNLMPWVQAVALGHRPVLAVYGTDYDTRDGTCVRDYIHVMDLAEGHVKAVQKLAATPGIACTPYNLGTGTGTTVLEMVNVRRAGGGRGRGLSLLSLVVEQGHNPGCCLLTLPCPPPPPPSTPAPRRRLRRRAVSRSTSTSPTAAPATLRRCGPPPTPRSGSWGGRRS